MHKKRNIFRKIALLPLMGVLLVVISMEPSQAATYYVSNNGSAAWPQCTNINTPCNTQAAFDNAVAGDTVNFRGGTYNLPQRNFGSTYDGYYNPAHSGTGDASNQRIIFQAYPGETPLFSGTHGGSGDGNHCYATIFATSGQDYITFNGFSFQADGGTWEARVHLGGIDGSNYSVGINFTHNTMNGGSIPCVDPSAPLSGDNNEGLRQDWTTNATIAYNTFYNYNSGYAYYTGVGAHKAYFADSTIIEHNEFRNSWTGIYFKSYGNGMTIRYNYFHDLSGDCVDASTNSHYENNGQIYHNICAKYGDNGFFMLGSDDTMNNWAIYNNTLYTTASKLTEGALFARMYFSATGWQIYNNVFQSTTGSDYSGNIFNVSGSGLVLTTLDYNNYGSIPYTFCGVYLRTTLADLKTETCGTLTTGQHDVHSLAAAPIFTNPALSQVSHFALTSSSPGYHAGSDGNDMGANVATVGTGASGSTNTLQAPTGLYIVP